MPTILVIDDDKQVRDMACDVLTAAGYTVVDEDNANAGIAAARRQSPDLILMDIRMPSLDGWTATRVIKSDPALSHIPIIAWTAVPIPGGEPAARAAGYDGYLPKPVDLSRFIQQVAALLPQGPSLGLTGPGTGQGPMASAPFSAAFPEARLIVIGSPESTQEMAQPLRRAGYQRVEIAPSGAAVVQAASGAHDLVLLDADSMRLEHLSAMCQARARQESAVPLLAVVSFHSAAAKTLGSLGLSTEDCVYKPVNGEELIARVSSRLRIKFLEDHLRLRQADLEVLYHASQMLSASLDVSAVLKVILEQAAGSVQATRIGLYLLDTDLKPLQQLHVENARDLPQDTLQAILARGAAGWVASYLEPVIIRDTTKDPRWIQIAEDISTRSALLVPLIGRAGVLGVLALCHDQVGHFSREHETLLSALAAQAAVALDNARLYEQARHEQQKLFAIVDSSADAVVVVDTAMRITMTNAVAGRLLGLHASMVGRSVKEALQPGPLTELFDSAANGGTPTGLEYDIENVPYHASVRPVPGVGYIALLQDVHLIKEQERLERERERQETERIRREFARHMSPQVVRLLLKRGETLAPRKCKAAVLFSDLRNYMIMTERIGVETMMEYVLKRYIAVMTDVVYANEGTIDKLLGDGIMAVFGVPLPQADAPQRALSTAMIMLRALTILREGWLRDLGQDITLGMGLAWGEVIAGNIGSSQRVDYTVIGDPVNVAARLGQLAAPGEVLLPKSFADEIGGDSPEWRLEPLPPMLIKGKEMPQHILRAVPSWPAF